MNNPSDYTQFDRDMMQRCLTLAQKAQGKTSPNPLVGSVIVQNGVIVGEGYHPQAGQPHAEVFALREAGTKAQGATVYVSLEPCNHYGRTPPCSQALVKAGVKKVVVGMVDPNPLVAGQGIETLRKAGIEVITGVEEEACQLLNEAFVHRILYQKPFGILKYAMTLDGKIATTTGHSRWITSDQSRHYVHQLRASCDAVIIGGNTLRQDNPYLTSHDVDDHNPLRVVMSRSLNVPTDRHLWELNQAHTIIFSEEGCNQKVYEKLLAKGVEIKKFPRLTAQKVMQDLYERGLSKILWECGGILAANAITEGAIQKIMAFIAPKIIGGDVASSPVGNLGLNLMSEALTLDRINIQKIDCDFLIEGYLKQN
jgi:diaminohydroxyphosphoribosylaminopyrimidine deaminase / 5-amino-6-(5-phosphoribosylamino)uracil reductase